MSENEPKVLSVQCLIYSNCGKTIIDTRNRQLTAKKRIGDIAFFGVVGGKDLARDFYRTCPIYKTEHRRVNGKRRSEHIKICDSTGYDLVSRHMSIQLPISAKQCRELLKPLLAQQVANIYVYTKSGSYGLPSMIAPSLCLQRYGFKNKWCASGSRPHNDWSFINGLLRQRGSPYRVLTSSLDLSSEKESTLAVTVRQLQKRIKQLEKGAKNG